MMHTPTIEHFFGAYLHQDWTDEFETSIEALRQFAHDEPGDVRSLLDELRELSNRNLSDSEFEEFAEKRGSFYLAANHNGGYRQWLSELIDEAHAFLSHAHPA